MRWKLLSAILGGLLLITNAAHLYHTVEQATVLAAREQLLYEFANKFRAAAAIAERCVGGKSREDALILLKQTSPGEEPFVKDGAVHSTWLTLTLKDGKLVQSIEVDEIINEWSRVGKGDSL
jgi:hypothetical protein